MMPKKVIRFNSMHSPYYNNDMLVPKILSMKDNIAIHNTNIEWEGQFFNVYGGVLLRQLILGNIYRPLCSINNNYIQSSLMNLNMLYQILEVIQLMLLSQVTQILIYYK